MTAGAASFITVQPTRSNRTNDIVSILTSKDPIVNWIIAELLPSGSLIQLAGEPGAGKSFFSYTLSMAIASGSSCVGFPVSRPLPVLYCDVENGRPDRDQYLRWSWHGLGKPSLELLQENLWTSHFELGNSDWASCLADKVGEIRPAFIVIDTATPACAIANENDNGEAANSIRELRRIQTLTSPAASILVLRHAKTFTEAGADGTIRRARGAQTWKGQSDATWFHVKAEGRPRNSGLNRTRIEPDKVRAFGLRDTLHIDASWTDGKQGIRLTRGKASGK